jgi:hypothetical protein
MLGVAGGGSGVGGGGLGTGGFVVNVAMAVMLPVILNEQIATELPGHTPVQFVKLEFAPGTAVKAIAVFGAKDVPVGVC